MKEQSKNNTASNRLTLVLFIIYLVALYWILLLKLGVQFTYMKERRANLVPFSETAIFCGENILNVMIFIPLGIYAGVLFERWVFDKKFLLFFSLSFLVEGLQYVLRLGAFDITDIITNTSGALVGLIIYHAIIKAFSNVIKAQKFINKIAATGTILLIILLVLLKMNIQPIRYQ